MIYLILYNRESKKRFCKYFEKKKKKDKFKRKLKYSNKIFVVEDSTEIRYL